MKYIKLLKDIRLTDIPLVGGKAAGLGEMIAGLSSKGVRVPDGFAITVDAYWYYLKFNKLQDQIASLLESLKKSEDLTL